MVQSWIKFTKRQPEWQRKKILDVIDKIANGDLEDLDISPSM